MERIMSRLLKTRTKVIGLHPGSLVFFDESGEKETVEINLINYNKDFFESSQSATLEDCVKSAKDKNFVTWIEFRGLRDNQVLEAIGNQFGIHRLWLEDVLNLDHRPKIEEMDDMLFAIIKRVFVDTQSQQLDLETSQIGILFGDGFVISFQHTKEDVFQPVKHRIENSVWKIRTLKADYLFCMLQDLLVDQYYEALDVIESSFEELESRVTTDVNYVTPLEIISLKREVLFLKKIIFPLKESLNKVINRRYPWVESKNLRYFQDVHDHIVQIVEVSDYYIDLVTSVMDFYQNAINSKMNEVMKVLTLFASLFIPLTFIVGIYGMNFKFMPELDWQYSYFIVWGFIISVAIGMLYFFKKKKWL